MYRSNLAYREYSQNNIGIESPQKLVEMLYEGVLRFNVQAKKSINDKNMEQKVYWLNRSVAVITELANILDKRGGDVALYLDGLYEYQIKLLADANIKNDTSKIDEVNNVFKSLIEAWREINQ